MHAVTRMQQAAKFYIKKWLTPKAEQDDDILHKLRGVHPKILKKDLSHHHNNTDDFLWFNFFWIHVVIIDFNDEGEYD